VDGSFGVKPKAMQLKNRQVLLTILRSAGPLSAPELSKRIGLSKTTVGKILAALQELHFVESAGKGESSDEGGKRPELFRFNASRGFAVAIHIAPTRLTVAIADLSGYILARRTVDIHENEKLSVVVDGIARTINSFLAEVGIAADRIIGICIGAHGITDVESGISLFSPHFPSWGVNVPLKTLIAEATGYSGPIAVDNQIRFQAYAELRSGVAQAFEDVVVIEGGEGLVAGIIAGGTVRRGVHRLAGEIGHMPLDPYDHEVCACGASGCFEILVSCSRVAARYEALSGHRLDSKGGPDRLRSVFKAASCGDQAALSSLDESASWFARGLANIILVADPEIIVFQGLYAEAGPSFLEMIRTHLAKLAVPGVHKDVVLAYSELGSDACLLGSTSYLIDEYFRRTLRTVEE